MKIDTLYKKFLTFLFAGVIVLILAGTFMFASVTRRSIGQRTIESFETTTTAATNQSLESLDHYTTLLYSGRSFINSSVQVYENEWLTFFYDQAMFTRFKGVAGVAFIQPTTEKNKPATLEKIRVLNDFSKPVEVKPAGIRESYGLVALAINQNDSKSIVGFDVFSTPERKEVYNKAQRLGQPVMSPVLKLADDRQGIFIVLPVKSDDPTKGYVTQTFYSEDIFPEIASSDALIKSPLKITDVTDKTNPNELYRSKGWRDDSKEASRTDTIDIAGRMWKYDYQMKPDYTSGITQNALPAIVIISGVILTILVAIVVLIILRLFLPKLGRPMF